MNFQITTNADSKLSYTPCYKLYWRLCIRGEKYHKPIVNRATSRPNHYGSIHNKTENSLGNAEVFHDTAANMVYNGQQYAVVA